MHLQDCACPVKLPLDVSCTGLQGSYSHSLAEYTLAACNWFAKDFPRLRAQQKARKWEPFDVEELRNKTMGVVGYGDIGQAAARIAHAFGMKISAMRRSERLSDQEKQEGLTVSPQMQYPPIRRPSAHPALCTCRSTPLRSCARHMPLMWSS